MPEPHFRNATTSRRLSAEPGLAAGFVLVGVVMMVLALTILGLSLFSLSSYEAQFVNRSLDDEQAVQFAMGGIDRARFALGVPPRSLAQVKTFLSYYVIDAGASQEIGGVTDSAQVLTPGIPVDIRVCVRYHSVTKTVVGRFNSTSEDNFYKRVPTVSSGGITVNPRVSEPPQDARGTVFLSDSIWQGNSDTNWIVNVGDAGDGINIRSVPAPTVESFMKPPPSGTTVVPYAPANYSLGESGKIRFYHTHNPSPGPSYGFSTYAPGQLNVSVSGRVVWMLPRGIRVNGLAHIYGGAGSCLVIVARNGRDSTYNDPGAIWFFGGLRADIPVVFVTDGEVKIEQFNQPTGMTLANQISIFANHVLLTGPSSASTSTMSLAYGTTIAEKQQMNDHVDALMAARALPNGVSSTYLSLQPGTWRVIK